MEMDVTCVRACVSVCLQQLPSSEVLEMMVPTIASIPLSSWPLFPPPVPGFPLPTCGLKNFPFVAKTENQNPTEIPTPNPAPFAIMGLQGIAHGSLR